MVFLSRLIQGRGVLDTECLWCKPKYKYQSSCKKECVLLLRVCKESVCRACLNFICKGGLFASVGPELMCKESVYRACLNFICWLLPKFIILPSLWAFLHIQTGLFCCYEMPHVLPGLTCTQSLFPQYFLPRTDSRQAVLHICYILWNNQYDIKKNIFLLKC